MADIYAAKDALIDLLKAAAVSPGPLTGVDVTYEWSAQSGTRQIYGGGVSFESEDAVAEPGVMTEERGIINLYVRAINKPPTSVEDTDAAVKALRATVQAILKANPTIAGSWTFVGITSGLGDYSQTDDETTSVLSLRIRVDSDQVW